MRPNTHKPTKVAKRQYQDLDITAPGPAPAPPHPPRHKLPRPTCKKDTPESITCSDQATDNTDSSDTTTRQEIDPDDNNDENNTEFDCSMIEDDTEAPKDHEDSCAELSAAIAAVECDMTFSSVLNSCTSRSSDAEQIDGLWGWDATRGSYYIGDAETKPPTEGANVVGEGGGTDKLHLLGDAMALVAEAEASAAADLGGSVSHPQLPAATGDGLPTLATPAVRPLGEVKRSFRDVYRKLRQNERRIKRVQRKLRMYTAEMQYLKSKRMRIWRLL
ncbi:uncharacterized protein H6S33_007124 [Morchella sextelata]|uniref:uncharacterized protein n=1 Tax=Morchella sextelata TaxID=1174677 RepID=UPI001D0378AC|nr:uncharacterized protein H6S33_007124 [Morchella sextelata]KAH0604093.1 hypothetical protein H6S33_007124 [Morchella sextelata]